MTGCAASRRLAAFRLAALVCAVLALSAPANAGAPIEHEYIPPNPIEDLQLQATTLNGAMPAAIDTPSGVVTAPNASESPFASGQAYGGASTPNSVDATYRIDRDTTPPAVVDYSDPFIPAVTPFKRLYAFDAVDSDVDLVVHDKSLLPLRIGGQLHPGDDQFYGDMVVDLAKGVPVRIPSVGPGARVLVAQTNPPTPFVLLHDGADNWFIRADVRARVRLTMELAIPRATFGSPFGDVTWDALAPHVAVLPDRVQAAAKKVMAVIGVSQALTPRAAVSVLVNYFRSFEPSSNRPRSSGVALYSELALSQKGVCRHRAYAFVITALALGLPARFVRNEAHAWVEVYDGKLWHRIDLGGAAGRIDIGRQTARQAYVPPRDPYSWPKGEQGAEALVQSSNAPGPPAAGSSASAAQSASSSTAPATPAESADDARPASHLTLSVSTASVQRGDPLAVSGSVQANGAPCRHARVDISLSPSSGHSIAIGSLATDASGRFSGQVVVPLRRVDVGDYDVVASTPGDARCGPGSTP